MEKIVKKVSKMISNDRLEEILEYMLTIYKYGEEVGMFVGEYLHEHPDEIDNVYTVVKCSNPSVFIIMNREKIFYIKNGEKFFNDQKQIFETIV